MLVPKGFAGGELPLLVRLVDRGELVVLEIVGPDKFVLLIGVVSPGEFAVSLGIVGFGEFVGLLGTVGFGELVVSLGVAGFGGFGMSVGVVGFGTFGVSVGVMGSGGFVGPTGPGGGVWDLILVTFPGCDVGLFGVETGGATGEGGGEPTDEGSGSARFSNFSERPD